MAIGPVQLIVLGFSHPEFHGEIIAELERLKESDTVRVIDALAVHKDADGEIEVAHLSNLSKDEAIELGSKVGALIGLGIEGEEGMVAGAEAGAEAAADGVSVFSDEEAWDVLEDIPNDSAAALILLEHHWAVPLRDAIARAGGFRLSDGFISPLDLVEIGLVTAEEAQRAPRRRDKPSARLRPVPPPTHERSEYTMFASRRVARRTTQARRAPPLDLRRAKRAPPVAYGGALDVCRRPHRRPSADVGSTTNCCCSVRCSGDHGHRLRRRPRVERPHLVVAAADDAAGRLGHLVPDAGDVAERFGDDQPRVVRELLEQLRVRGTACAAWGRRSCSRASATCPRSSSGRPRWSRRRWWRWCPGRDGGRRAGCRPLRRGRSPARSRPAGRPAGRRSARGRTAPRCRSGPRSSGTATDRWRARGRA